MMNPTMYYQTKIMSDLFLEKADSSGVSFKTCTQMDHFWNVSCAKIKNIKLLDYPLFSSLKVRWWMVCTGTSGTTMTLQKSHCTPFSTKTTSSAVLA